MSVKINTLEVENLKESVQKKTKKKKKMEFMKKEYICDSFDSSVSTI